MIVGGRCGGREVLGRYDVYLKMLVRVRFRSRGLGAGGVEGAELLRKSKDWRRGGVEGEGCRVRRRSSLSFRWDAAIRRSHSRI